MTCEPSCTAIRTLGGAWLITDVDAPAVCMVALVTSSENTNIMSATLPHPHPCTPLWKTLRPAAIVDWTVIGMSKISSFISGATDGWPLVRESDAPPALYLPSVYTAQPVRWV